MRNKNMLSRIGGMALLAALGATLTLDSVGCSKETLPAARQDIIRVGLSVSLTGDNRGVGAAIRDGSVAAANLINSKGGVLGKRLELDIQDDASDNSERGGVPNAGAILREKIQYFLDSNVIAILGPGASVQLREAQAMAYPRNDAGVPIPGTSPTLMISSWSTSVSITDIQKQFPDRYLYRTAPSDTGQRRALIKLMREEGAPLDGGTVGPGESGTPHRCDQPALVYGNDILGQAFDAYIRPYYTDTLKLPVKSFPVPTGDVGDPTAFYNPTLQQIIDFKPDCVVLVIYGAVAKQFMPLLKQRTRSLPAFARTYYIGADALFDESVLNDLKAQSPADSAEGMFGVVPDTRPDSPEFREFRKIFRSQTDTIDGAPADPQAYSSSAFDAVILLALAMQKAGTSTDTGAIRDALVEVSRGYKDDPAVGPFAKSITPATLDQAFTAFTAGQAINYRGASGPVDLDNLGDIKSGYKTWRVNKRAFEELITYLENELPQ